MTRRKTRRGGSAAKPPLYGIGAFDSNIYAIADDPSGTPGSATGFFVACVCRVSAPTGTILFSFDGTLARWQLRVDSYIYSFVAHAGDGTPVISPGYQGVAGGIVGIVAVHDGTKLRLYAQGVQSADGTSITGFFESSSSMYIGAGGGGGNFIDWFGCAYGTGVPSAQNITDWWASTRSARAVQDMPGASPATRLWRPGSALGNVTDLVGGKVLQMGAPQDQVLRVVGTPNWG